MLLSLNNDRMNKYDIWSTDGKNTIVYTDFTLTDLLRFVEDGSVKIFDYQIVNFKYVTSIYKKDESK